MFARNILDHCLIIVRNSTLNKGPKPFKVLNYWFSHEGFFKIVEEYSSGRMGCMYAQRKIKAS